MKIRFLGTDLCSKTSGQRRFLANLAVGMSRAGHQVEVVVLSASEEMSRTLDDAGVVVESIGYPVDSLRFRVLRMTRANPTPTLLAKKMRELAPIEWCVVLSDDAVTLSESLLHGARAYICQGDMALLLTNRSFVQGQPISRELAGVVAANLIRRHARAVEAYDLRLANSRFTHQLMSYLYGVPFDGVVYPPVDLIMFHPPRDSPTASYVLALARNESEQNLQVLETLAERVPLRVIGGAHVRGAENLDVVSESTLVELYGNAALVVAPVLSEPFGYAVAESIACGTPVVAFDSGGPSELISATGAGGVAVSHGELIRLVEEMFRDPPGEAERARMSRSASLFSMEASARALTNLLSKDMYGRRPWR